MLLSNSKRLYSESAIIEIKQDELLGEYITINIHSPHNRDSIVIKIIDEDQFTIGELVITESMKVFYNHKKRCIK